MRGLFPSLPFPPLFISTTDLARKLQKRTDSRLPPQIELVAEFAEVPLNRVPRVNDIEHEV